jgi:malonyl-CoA/methylmalonyl-CoA synthetase
MGDTGARPSGCLGFPGPRTLLNVLMIPFLHALQTTFREQTSRPALVHEGLTWTYGELEARARDGATRLQSLGVAVGDRVVLCTSNKAAFLLAHLATLWAGAISLPLNPRFTRAELRFFLSDSGARIAIAGDEARPLLESLRLELPDLLAVVPDTVVGDEPKCMYSAPEIAPENPCLMLYSSGTTGWPKGVMHTHANVASGLRALQSCWRFTPDDVVLNVLPLFHIHGLCFATQLALLTGACVILDEFEPQMTMQRVKECTVFMAVPTIYYRFLEQPSFQEVTRTWKRPRLFTCGSAPIRAEVLPELEAILGKPVINRYGMTEAFVITSLPLQGPRPYGSVGLPLDGIETRIKTEAGLASAGEVGAVQVRGQNLFREYWKNPDATAAAWASGWFDTGDLGFHDDAGYLTLVGRKNDLIITSGFNVYPQVVERVINDCPGVLESAVLGVPDDRKGERVVAVVVREDPTLDEERLRTFWSERLVDYQRPKSVVYVDALPRNAMGKVQRRALRDIVDGEKP